MLVVRTDHFATQRPPRCGLVLPGLILPSERRHKMRRHVFHLKALSNSRSCVRCPSRRDSSACRRRSTLRPYQYSTAAITPPVESAASSSVQVMTVPLPPHPRASRRYFWGSLGGSLVSQRND